MSLLMASCITLAGCASTRVQLESVPDDARIYVDGEYLGKGTVSLDVGSEYNFPKTYHLKVRRDGYETLERTIRNEPDYARAGMWFGLNAMLGGFMLVFATTQQLEMMRNYYIGLGLFSLAFSPIAFFSSNKFRKAYELEMEKNGGSPNKGTP